MVTGAESSVMAPHSVFTKELMDSSLNVREGEAALHRALNGLNERLEATERVFKIVPEPAPVEKVLNVQVSWKPREGGASERAR